MSKFNPKATKSKEHLQHVAQGSQNGAPGTTMEPQGLHKLKSSPKLQNKTYQKVPLRGQTKKKNHIPTNNQPTKETKRDTNKQTIEQTHTHAQELPTANTNTNSRGRVLAEGDVDPPRCFAPIAGVLGHLVQKNLAKSFRTDKVNSLGACTHRPFAKVPKTFVKHDFQKPNRRFSSTPEAPRPRRRIPAWGV